MPTLKKLCPHPGCTAITTGGRCDRHATQKYIGRQRTIEGQERHKLYDTVLWQRARAAHLNEFPLCIECQSNGLTVAATDVDHIEPHKGDTAKFLDRANLQSLCHSCHSRKTARENA